MFKSVLFSSIFILSSFFNVEVIAGNNTKVKQKDNIVEVSDEEIENLILNLEKSNVSKNTTDLDKNELNNKTNENKSNDPYFDLNTTLTNYKVKGLEREIITGLISDDTPTNLVSSIILLYTNISNFFIHPIFVLFIIFTLISLIVSSILCYLNYKRGNVLKVQKYLSFSIINVLFATCFITLMYEDFTGYSIFKKYFLLSIYGIFSIFIGYIIGNIFSKFYFEDKILP